MLGTAWEPAFQNEALRRSHQHRAALPKTGPARPGLQGPLQEQQIWGRVQAPFSPLSSFRLSWGIRPGSLPQAGRVVTSGLAPHQRRPEAWAPASAPGPCSCCPVLGLWRLPRARVQPGLSRTPTASRRPLPGGHSHPSSAWEALSSGASPMDSASAACRSTPRGSGLCRLAPRLCLLVDAAHPVSNGDWSPALPGVHVAPLVSRHCGFSATPGSRQHLGQIRSPCAEPSGPEVLAAPPSPSPTAIPLPLLHVWPQVGTAGRPGQQAPPVEIPPARPHSTLKPPLPSPHRRVTLPETSPFHSRAQGCACGAAGSGQDQSLCYCSRWRKSVGWTRGSDSVRGVPVLPMPGGVNHRPELLPGKEG